VAEWTVETYRTDDGRTPARAFLDTLTGDEAAQAAALIRLLQAHGNALRPPHSKLLEAGLWEMRRHQVRLFYTFRPGRRAVLLDGMVKKQDKIPTEVMQRLRRYRQDLDASEGEARGRQ